MAMFPAPKTLRFIPQAQNILRANRNYGKRHSLSPSRTRPTLAANSCGQLLRPELQKRRSSSLPKRRCPIQCLSLSDPLAPYLTCVHSADGTRERSDTRLACTRGAQTPLATAGRKRLDRLWNGDLQASWERIAGSDATSVLR